MKHEADMAFFLKNYDMINRQHNIRQITDAWYNTAINRRGMNAQKYVEAECHQTKCNLK